LTPPFSPALELNARFYRQVVGPALDGIPHASARLGTGSEVLGFDTEQSTDHGWGPRLNVFVAPDAVRVARAAIERALPETFEGWPVRYGWDAYPVRDYVEVDTLPDWLQATLACNPLEGMSTIDWLATPQQLLLGVVRGAVYHDDAGRLTAVRRALAWFPTDVARWLIACQWRRIAQEEAFVGRAAQVGDDIGSRLVAARLVREVMRLHFLLCGEYWPYTKWFGSAYRALDGADALLPILAAAVDASAYAAREDALVAAYEFLSRMQNDSGLADPIDPTARQFYSRPFRVIVADRFATACAGRVQDPWLRGLPLVGSIDQFVDSTDVLSYPQTAARLRAAYES
jgi:hypothetical protein